MQRTSNLSVYSKEGSFKTHLPDFMTLEEFVERELGIIVSDSIGVKKSGFCKKTGKHFSVVYKRISSVYIMNTVRLFEEFSKLTSKHIHGYEHLLVLEFPQMTEEQIMLIAEVVDGVNVNNLVGDLGDNISETHYKAVTCSLREILKIDMVMESHIEKPISFLQENGEIKCVFNLFEKSCFDANALRSTKSLSRKNSRNSQYVMDLYKKWYGDNGILKRDFKDLEEIGRGGFGSVYKATHILDNQTYAIKEIQLSRKVTIKEAELWSELKHPNIVRYHDCWKHAQMLYIKMEFVPGGTLKRFIETTKAAPYRREALNLSQQICKGLRYLHSKNIIHRDIKSENFLISKDQRNKPTAKLTDFGFSKYYQATDVYKGYTPGTIGYAPPEKLLTLPSDIYSLGVVLTELFFCEDPRDLDKELKELKLNNEHDVELGSREVNPVKPPTLMPSFSWAAGFFYPDHWRNSSKNSSKIAAYEDFLMLLSPKQRKDIDECLTNLTSKSRIHAKLFKPLKVIPFEIWIRQLLADCLKLEPTDRPDIRKVQQSLIIAGGIK